MNGPVAIVCLGILATLSAGTASAGMTASSAADGSMVLLQTEAVIARQSVVTGAMGVPISVDIAKGITLASLPAASTPTLAPRIMLESQAVSPIIAPRLEIGTTQQASFVISGDQDLAVSIAIPTSVPLAKVGGGGDVEFATTSSLGYTNIGQSRLAGSEAGSGLLAFDVGGHVEMKQNALAGAYAGVLRVTVQYN
jgi:hypothetical protein